MQRLNRAPWALLGLACVLFPAVYGSLQAQTSPSLEERIKRDKEFPHEKPGIGDSFPELTIYRPDGTPVNTSDLRGRYVVLTFGCLT